MNVQWFECRVKYTKRDEETQKDKKVRENYLVSAVSVTDAEASITEKLNEILNGVNFTISGASEVKFSEIFNSDDFKFWYKSKVVFKTLGGDNGKSKSIKENMLIRADSVEHASRLLKTKLSDETDMEFDIDNVSKSSLIDVFDTIK